MLPKNERLRSGREFKTVYNMKKSVANSLLILYTGRKKEDPDSPTKVGFVVGKKVHKRAVKRNRAKRLMRESFRNIRKTENFLLKDRAGLIFLARPEIVEADYHTVYSAVEDCIQKAYKKFATKS